jgi:hypothetical protein
MKNNNLVEVTTTTRVGIDKQCIGSAKDQELFTLRQRVNKHERILEAIERVQQLLTAQFGELAQNRN